MDIIRRRRGEKDEEILIQVCGGIGFFVMQIIRNQILVQLSDPHIRSATFKYKIAGPLKPSLAFEDYMLAIITFSCKG